MTLAEAAALLGVSERHARTMIQRGVLRAVKHGPIWWVEPDAVEEARQRPGQWRNRKDGDQDKDA